MSPSELETCLILAGFKPCDKPINAYMNYYMNYWPYHPTGTKFFKLGDIARVDYYISRTIHPPTAVASITVEGGGAGNITSKEHFGEWMKKIAEVKNGRCEDSK